MWQTFRTNITPVAHTLAVVGPFALVVVWGLRLQDRVDTLSVQVQALLTSPPVSKAELQPPAVTASPQRSSGTAAQTLASPSVETQCANLTIRVADQIQKDGFETMVVAALKRLMTDLGCNKR